MPRLLVGVIILALLLKLLPFLFVLGAGIALVTSVCKGASSAPSVPQQRARTKPQPRPKPPTEDDPIQALTAADLAWLRAHGWTPLTHREIHPTERINP